MTNKTTKAKVTKVSYAGFEFDGLKMLDGTYALGASQIAEIFQFAKDHASRTIKSLLGKDFLFAKCYSELNPKEVNVMKLEDFSILILKLAFKGDSTAQILAIESVKLTLEQAFDIAFDNKKKLEEYQEHFKARVEGKQSRRSLTDAIRDYIKRNPNMSPNAKKFAYSNATDACYLKIIGMKKGKAAKVLSLKNCHSLRDNLSAECLKELDYYEYTAAKIIDQRNMPPLQAINVAFQLCSPQTFTLSK
jgi:hypothetical protein